MNNNYYSNICTLIDCFTEGILIIDSENRIIVNNRFGDFDKIIKKQQEIGFKNQSLTLKTEKH